MQYPGHELPIDPYTFGVWLGDGTSTKAEITTADEQVLEEIGAAGYAVWPATARSPTASAARIAHATHTQVDSKRTNR